MSDFAECDLTYAENCIYEDLSFENDIYCCDYILGSESDDEQISQQQLFTKITWVHHLNIASLASDYFFVVLAVIILCVMCKRGDKQTVKKYTLLATSVGSIVDIILTFTIVGIFSQNNLIDAFLNLHHKKCYSEDIELTIIDFQDGFENILILDVLEVSLDIFSLIILFVGYFKCRKTTFEDMAEGVHGFIFGLFDLIIITVNVVIFVIPTYNAFQSAYNNEQYICFKKTILGDDDTDDINWGFSSTELPQIGTTEVQQITSTQQVMQLLNVTQAVEKQWYDGLNQSERVWMGVGFAMGGLCIFPCIFCFCYCCLRIFGNCCDDKPYNLVSTA